MRSLTPKSLDLNDSCIAQATLTVWHDPYYFFGIHRITSKTFRQPLLLLDDLNKSLTKPIFWDEPVIREETKGGFVKGWFLTNVLSFRFFRSGGTCERTLVPVPFRGTSECTLVSAFVLGEHPPKPLFLKTTLFQRKIQGQQLKGKIVSEFFTLFHTFFTLFHTFFHTFSHFFRILAPGLSPSKQRVLGQGEHKRRKDNKKNGTNRCCKLVVARLSSSYFWESPNHL